MGFFICNKMFKYFRYKSFMIEKICTKCEINWAVNTKEELSKFFDIDRSKNDGLYSSCKTCKAKLKKSSYKAYFHKNSNRQMKQNFGISLGDYERILELQDFKCAICRISPPTTKRFSVDHCHKTNRVRGLLCNGCNLGIGIFKDNTSTLNSAINYINLNNDHRAS